MNIIIVLTLALTGLFGAWYHWIEVQKRGEPGNFFDYFFRNNTDGSKAACIAFVAAMETIYIAGGFNGLELSKIIDAFKVGELYAPLVTALAAAFGAGYGCDSKLNSGIMPIQTSSPLQPSPTSSLPTEQVLLPQSDIENSK